MRTGLKEFRSSIESGYTLSELLVVLVIIGIVIGLAIPNYSKTMEESYESDAVKQLRSIHTANMAYFARNDQWWPPDNNSYNTASINTNLKLNLIESQLTYSCTGTDGTTFTCTATRSGGAYTIRVDEDDLAPNNVNPCSTRKGATCS